MSRLRHPIRAIREPFGKAGLTVAIVALVFAMVGGAFAAAGLNGKQKKEVTKIAKKYAGKPGSAGPQGAAGPAGPQGPAGAPGPKGDTGAKGDTGTAGANGKSVETGTATAGECPTGGATVQVASEPATKKKICNGAAGAPGPEGDPWTAGGTLPSGETETGAWTLGTVSEGAAPSGTGVIRVPISFTLPLPSELDGTGCKIESGSVVGPCEVHFINAAGKELILNMGTFSTDEVDSTECLGSAAAPSAEPGNLCIYTAELSGAQPSNLGFAWGDLAILKAATPGATGASTAGAFLGLDITANNAQGAGTWAVTAP